MCQRRCRQHKYLPPSCVLHYPNRWPVADAACSTWDVSWLAPLREGCVAAGGQEAWDQGQLSQGTCLRAVVPGATCMCRCFCRPVRAVCLRAQVYAWGWLVLAYVYCPSASQGE